MKFKALVLDYGGTIDSPGVHWSQLMWNAYTQHKVSVTFEQFHEAYVHVERTLGRYDIIHPDFTFHETLTRKLQLQLEYLSLFGGERERLLHLRDAMVDTLYAATRQQTARNRSVLERLRSRYPLVLVSNFYGNLATVLREFQLSDLFLHVVESARVGIRKPDPGIFQLAVDWLELPAREVLVVGDSIKNDILPARSIGCQTAWLTGRDNAETKPLAEVRINQLEQLLDVCDA